MSCPYDGSPSPLDFDKEVSSDYLNSVLSSLSDESGICNSSPQSNASDQAPEVNHETLKNFASSSFPLEAQEMNEMEMNNILNQDYQQFSNVVEMSQMPYTSPDFETVLQRLNSSPTLDRFSSSPSQQQQHKVAQPVLLVPKIETSTFEDLLERDDILIKSEEDVYLPHNGQLSLLLCPICGNEAGKHVHYGGRACTSCRAFFRRSVQHEAYKKFYCSSKSCKIDSKSWRSCKWCRFEKCIASGLQPGWVLSDTERQARHEKRISKTGVKKRLKMLKHEEPVEMGIVTLSSANSIHWSFSESELITIRNTIQNGYNKLVKSLFRFYAQNSSLYSNLTRAVYSNTVVPYNMYTKWEKIWPLALKKLAVNESKLITLSSADIETLLRENFASTNILIQASLMMNRQAFKQSFLAEIMTRAITLTPGENDLEDVKVLHGVMKDLDVGMNLPAGALSYNQVFYTPWADSIDLEERHSQLLSQIGFWPVDHTDPSMPVDYAKLFLLCNVFLLSPDNVVLNDHAKVRKLRDTHLNMLVRYLRFKYKDQANAELAQGLALFAMAKEVLEIRSHRLPV